MSFKQVVLGGLARLGRVRCAVGADCRRYGAQLSNSALGAVVCVTVAGVLSLSARCVYLENASQSVLQNRVSGLEASLGYVLEDQHMLRFDSKLLRTELASARERLSTAETAVGHLIDKQARLVAPVNAPVNVSLADRVVKQAAVDPVTAAQLRAGRYIPLGSPEGQRMLQAGPTVWRTVDTVPVRAAATTAVKEPVKEETPQPELKAEPVVTPAPRQRSADDEFQLNCARRLNGDRPTLAPVIYLAEPKAPPAVSYAWDSADGRASRSRDTTFRKLYGGTWTLGGRVLTGSVHTLYDSEDRFDSLTYKTSDGRWWRVRYEKHGDRWEFNAPYRCAYSHDKSRLSAGFAITKSVCNALEETCRERGSANEALGAGILAMVDDLSSHPDRRPFTVLPDPD